VPTSSKEAQARAVKQQIDTLDHKVEVAAEQYNESKAKYDKLVSERKAAETRLAKTQKRIGQLQLRLGTRADSMYRSGPLQFMDVLLGAESFDDFASTWDVLKDLNEDDAAAVAELKVAREEAKQAKAEIGVKEAAAKQQVKVMSSNKKSIEGQLSSRKRLLSGLEAEIAAIEAAEARRAATQARTVVRTRAKGEKKFPPPTRAARSEVVSIAKRYLGAPYRWGASGPNSFDCSGFTMFVYRQVGVSLPHSSRAQIRSGQRVSRDQLQPGDLVFFGSPIHHVGIYIGGGQYIHAPRTGDVVKISSLSRGDYAGACRP